MAEHHALYLPELRREKAREQVRRLDLDLYPPGAEPDSVEDLDSVGMRGT